MQLVQMHENIIFPGLTVDDSLRPLSNENLGHTTHLFKYIIYAAYTYRTVSRKGVLKNLEHHVSLCVYNLYMTKLKNLTWWQRQSLAL